MLRAAARQARSLAEAGHRPWPLPQRSWLQGQTWEELLFAHWPVAAGALRELVPAALEIEEHDGSAWIGVTPFRLSGLRLRGTLPVPIVSSFLELNVRTYVRAGDRPGIWFFSLDASSRFAVELARRTYKLPYFQARMTIDREDEWIDYECVRDGQPTRAFIGRYRPVGGAFRAEPASLEWFLTERYCLYAADGRDRLLRAEIHHAPWSLEPAEAELEAATIAPVELIGDPLCHFARRQDTLIWSPERV